MLNTVRTKFIPFGPRQTNTYITNEAHPGKPGESALIQGEVEEIRTRNGKVEAVKLATGQGYYYSRCGCFGVT